MKKVKRYMTKVKRKMDNKSVYSSVQLGYSIDEVKKRVRNYYPKKEQISTFKLNNNYNKIKINVKKTDTSSLFNLLGIYLGNEDLTKGVVYNSLGVGGSNLNSIVNNNSLVLINSQTSSNELNFLFIKNIFYWN